MPPVCPIVYENIPKEGYLTGITYGLSLCYHPMWKLGRPELSIVVNSGQLEWCFIVAHIANNLKGECPFSYGEVINFGQRIAPDSEMSAFFIFAPSIFDDKHVYSKIDIGLEYKINLVALYPMYESEIEVFHEIGLDAFWHHPNFDMYDVRRDKVTV